MSYCRPCSDTRLRWIDTGGRVEACPHCASLSPAEHAARVYAWHLNRANRKRGADPAWARRWLDRRAEAALLTAEERDAILRRHAPAVQLTLFA